MMIIIITIILVVMKIMTITTSAVTAVAILYMYTVQKAFENQIICKTSLKIVSILT